jgi:ubiquinone/menaquinone biosynthesis C-methylase UbiE
MNKEGANALEKLQSRLKNYRNGQVDPVTRTYWDMHYQLNLKKAIDNTKEGDLILDVGCGTGAIIVDLAKANRTCFGVDPLYEISLLRARSNAAKSNVDVELVQSFSESLPFRARVFDMVLLLSTLQHVADQDKTLQEIKRVLKENGVLLISVPMSNNLFTILRRKKKPEHFTKIFDIENLLKLIKKNGFEIKDVSGCGLFPPLSHKLMIIFYRIFGKNATEKVINTLQLFATCIPSAASSVIILSNVISSPRVNPCIQGGCCKKESN